MLILILTTQCTHNIPQCCAFT